MIAKRQKPTWLSCVIATFVIVVSGCASLAQVPLTGAGRGAPAAAGGGCSQATTFLARTSLAGSDITNYTNLICGMVTDGLITGNLSTTGCGSLFDVLYIFATADATTALLNICSTNFGGVNTLLPFTAYTGFSADGNSLHQIDTQFNATTATTPNYTQNLAHFSIWNLTNIAEGKRMLNIQGAAAGVNLFPKNAGDNSTYARVNDNPESSGFTITDERGHLLGNRSSSTARQLYQNASTTLNGGTVATYGSQASQAPINADFVVLQDGTRTATMVSIGGSLTSTQVTNFYNRLRTYMTAVGVP